MTISPFRAARISAAMALALAATLSQIPTAAHATVGMAASSPASTPDADTAANIEIVRTFLNEVVNGGRFELVDRLWAPNMVWRGGSQGVIHGRETYRRILEASVGGSFTHMHLDIKDIVAVGDKVVVRFTNSGDNTGAFMGHPASGRHAVWEGIGIYRIENGQIAEAWFSEDILGMYQQLGFIQPPP